MNVEVPAFEQITVLPTDCGGVISVYPGFATTGKLFVAPIDETDAAWDMLDAQTRAFLQAIMVDGVALVVIFGRFAGLILDDPERYNEVARTIQDQLVGSDLVSTENVRYVSAGLNGRPWHEMPLPGRWRVGDPMAVQVGAGPAVVEYLRYADFAATVVPGMPGDDELYRLMSDRRERQGIVLITDDPDGIRWNHGQ